MKELNKIKNVIQNLVELVGEGTVFNEGDWSVDYKLDLDEEFHNELNNLYVELNLLIDALHKKDFLTVKCALVMARLYSLNLSNLFINIFDDIEKIGWSEEFKLPNVPDNYQIPEHYNYPKK